MIGGVIEGIVLDDVGQVVEGATVEVRSGAALVGIGVSNAQGYYRVADLPVGTLSVMAHRRGFLSSQTISITTSAGVTTPNANLTLTRLPAALLSTVQPEGRYARTVQLGAERLTANVESVEFQYRQPGDQNWTSIGTSATAPFVLAWDTDGIGAAGQETASRSGPSPSRRGTCPMPIR